MYTLRSLPSPKEQAQPSFFLFGLYMLIMITIIPNRCIIFYIKVQGMSFLVDYNQIEGSGIDYLNTLFGKALSRTGGLVTGDIEFGVETGDFYLYGTLNSRTGIIFSDELGRMGVGTIPSGKIHIKSTGAITWGVRNDGGTSSIVFKTNGGNATGEFYSNTSGDLYLRNIKKTESKIILSGTGIEEFCSIGDGEIRLETITLGEVSFRGECENNSHINDLDNVTKYYNYGIYESGNCLGNTSFLVYKPMFRTGYVAQSGVYCWGIEVPEITQADGYYSINQELSGENKIIGNVIGEGAEEKYQYFITGTGISVLKLNLTSGIYPTGGNFTIYAKKVGGFKPVNTEYFWGESRSGIMRSANFGAGGTSWGLSQSYSTTNIDYNLYKKNGSAAPRYSKISINRNLVGNQIYLMQFYGSTTDIDFKIANYGTGSINYSIYTGINVGAYSTGYANASTEILLQSGCLCEVGMVNRTLTTQETQNIFLNANLLDAMPNTGEITYLFRMDEGSGSGIYDDISGYSGFIVNYNGEFWK